ncbi:MAG: thioredoxin [Bdellovibrionales bacterium]
MGENVKHITDADFDAEVTNTAGLVLVDFWAEWCGPCRQLGPVIDELAASMADKVKVVKANVDQAQETAAKFGIRSIPTLILFKDGQPLETKVGGMPKQALEAWLSEDR